MSNISSGAYALLILWFIDYWFIAHEILDAVIR